MTLARRYRQVRVTRASPSMQGTAGLQICISIQYFGLASYGTCIDEQSSSWRALFLGMDAANYSIGTLLYPWIISRKEYKLVHLALPGPARLY